jgi:hypothetical protein
MPDDRMQAPAAVHRSAPSPATFADHQAECERQEWLYRGFIAGQNRNVNPRAEAPDAPTDGASRNGRDMERETSSGELVDGESHRD